MDTSHKIGSSDGTHRLHSSNPPLKSWKTYGFAIAIIIGIGGLAVVGVGAVGCFGAISNLTQVHAIIMIAAGGGGGTVLFIVGVVGSVKNCKTGSASVRQTEFIKRAGARTYDYFGKAGWKTYFGCVVEEVSPHANISEILNSPCPFSGDKSIKVNDTHMLVLVPATVNGEALTLNKLHTLIQNPKKGRATHLHYSSTQVYDEHGSTQVERSHWVLMTRDVIPGSRNKTYEEQKELVNQYKDYGLPEALEAAVCISIKHVFSGFKLFGNRPLTYTRCTETVDGQPVIVGGFGGFLWVKGDSQTGSPASGVAALRKV